MLVLCTLWAPCRWWEMFLSTTWCKHFQPIRIDARKTEIITQVTFPPLVTWTLRWWSIILHKLSDLHAAGVCLAQSVICQSTAWAQGNWRKAELGQVIWEVPCFLLVFILEYLTELGYSSAKGKPDEFSTCSLYGRHFLMSLIRKLLARKLKSSKKIYLLQMYNLNHVH